MKFALQNGANHPLCQGVAKFGEILEEKSGGRITLDLAYSGSLGDKATTVQGMQTGTIDAAMLMGGVIADYGCDQLKVFSLPYLFTSVTQARNFEKSDAGRALLDTVQSSGTRIVCIGAYQESARNYFFKDTRVEKPLSGFVNNAFQEVSDYYVLDQHETSPNLILFSKLTWNRLSDADKALVMEAFNESVPFFEEISDAKDAEYLQTIKDSGTITILYLGLSPIQVVNTLVDAVDGFTFLAIPFFILSGDIMAHGGISDRLILLADACVGWMRGGLAMVNVLASVFFGGDFGVRHGGHRLPGRHHDPHDGKAGL